MRQRDTFGSAALFAVLAIVILWIAGAALTSCHSNANGGNALADSFFPLAKGNCWVFAWYERGREMGRDSVHVKAVAEIDGERHFLMIAPWPGFDCGLWVRRDAHGDLVWLPYPGTQDRILLRPKARVGDRWVTGFEDQPCADTLAMSDDYAVVATPYGLFDGAKQFGAVNQCADYGWGISLARGVGPVQWMNIGFAGTRSWLLVSARIHDDPGNPSGSAHVVDGD